MYGRKDVNTVLCEKIEQAFAQNLLYYVQAVQAVAPQIHAEAISVPEVSQHLQALGRRSPRSKALVRRSGMLILIQQSCSYIGGARAKRSSNSHYGVGSLCTEVTAARLHGDRVRRCNHSPFAVRCSIPLHRVAQVDPAVWSAVQLHVSEEPDTPQWRLLTQAAGHVRDAMRFGILDAGDVRISCAEVFPVGDIALFANDATLQTARGRGAQTATIHDRLRELGAHEFALATAEVATGSTSERNYLRCGFRVCYARSQ